jgi:hypothetical protein
MEGEPFAIRQLAMAKCRYGSKADKATVTPDVRFSPEGDHIAAAH